MFLTKKLLLLFSLFVMQCPLFAQWGENDTRTDFRDDAGAWGAGVKSGFYQTVQPINYPSGATGWWHLLDIRHSNAQNNYAMQFAGGFFDQQLYFRKTNSNGTQPWSRVLLESEGLVGVGTTSPRYTLHSTAYNNAGTAAAYLWGQHYGASVGIGNNSAAYYAFAVHGNINPDGSANGGTKDLFYVRGDGNTGIGTNNPVAKLHIEGDQYTNGSIRLATHSGIGTYSQRISIGESGNSDPMWLARFNVAEDQTELRINIGDGEDTYDKFIIGTTRWYDELWVPGFSVNAKGQVGVGTTDTKGYRLAVNGDALFTKIKVKEYTAWPDYVFEPAYRLPSLSEVEQFIKSHKHLPEVPSAKEVEEKGLDLGENQAALLKKIEELTLYAIEADKKNKELEERLKILEEKLR